MEHEMDQCSIHSLVDVAPLYSRGDVGSELESESLEIPLNLNLPLNLLNQWSLTLSWYQRAQTFRGSSEIQAVQFAQASDHDSLRVPPCGGPHTQSNWWNYICISHLGWEYLGIPQLELEDVAEDKNALTVGTSAEFAAAMTWTQIGSGKWMFFELN